MKTINFDKVRRDQAPKGYYQMKDNDGDVFLVLPADLRRR